MAKRTTKKAEVKLFDEKKEEVIYDFGEVKIPTCWKEVTLQMMCDFYKAGEDKKKLLESDTEEAKLKKTDLPDENDEKYNVTDKDIIRCFTTIDPEKIDVLPVEFFERIMSTLSFMVTQYEQKPPTNRITVNGHELIINFMEGLKVKEYKDADTILRTNPTDYPSLLAVLCREVVGRKKDMTTGIEWDVNEPYDEEFANHIFDGRRAMFANMPVEDAMPLIAFFLMRSEKSSIFSQRYLTTAAHQLKELVENLENSIEFTDLSRWSKMRVKRTLKKYREQIDSIC